MKRKGIILLLMLVLIMAMASSVYAEEVVVGDPVESVDPVEPVELDILDKILAELDPESFGEDATQEEIINLAVEQGLLNDDGVSYTAEELNALFEADKESVEPDVLDKILAKLDTEGLGEDATLEDIVNLAVEQGLLNDDGVPYTAEELTTLIEAGEEVVEEGLQNEALERVALARELGITPGKLNLIQKYAKSTGDPESIDVTLYLDTPVKVLMKEIKTNRKATEIIEGEEVDETEVLEESTVLEASLVSLEEPTVTEKVKGNSTKAKSKKSKKSNSKKK